MTTSPSPTSTDAVRRALRDIQVQRVRESLIRLPEPAAAKR
jgi:hypothetical protein